MALTRTKAGTTFTSDGFETVKGSTLGTLTVRAAIRASYLKMRQASFAQRKLRHNISRSSPAF